MHGGGGLWSSCSLMLRELALHSLLGQKQVAFSCACRVGLSPADIKVKGDHLLLRSMSAL